MKNSHKSQKIISNDLNFDSENEANKLVNKIKENTKKKISGIGKLYSSEHLFTYWIVSFFLIFVGAAILFIFIFVEEIKNDIYKYLIIFLLVIGFASQIILLFSRIKFYNEFKKIYIVELNNVSKYKTLVNQISDIYEFEYILRDNSDYLKDELKNVIIVNENIDIDILSCENVLNGMVENNEFNLSSFKWKINNPNIKKIESYLIIQMFTPYFCHHIIDVTNKKRQSNEFLIKTNNDEFDKVFFIYSIWEDRLEYASILKEVKKIFNEKVISKLLKLYGVDVIKKEFRLLIKNGYIYFSFNNSNISDIKYFFSLWLIKRQTTKIIINNVVELLNIMNFLFSINLFKLNEYN